MTQAKELSDWLAIEAKSERRHGRYARADRFIEASVAVIALDAKDAALADAKAKTTAAYAEIVRLRQALNLIAWPGAIGINPEHATLEMARHIARDALAIGKTPTTEKPNA